MSDGVTPRAEDAFEAIDPRLNVFALANGMDLTKEAGSRRLEWFTDGLERGIVIEVREDGFRVGVASWRTGSTEIVREASVGGALSSDDVMGILDSSIEAANRL